MHWKYVCLPLEMSLETVALSPTPPISMLKRILLGQGFRLVVEILLNIEIWGGAGVAQSGVLIFIPSTVDCVRFCLGDRGDCGRRRTADRAFLYILGPLAALIAEVRGPWTA